MDHQPVPSHPQKRMIRGQLGQPSLRSHAQGYKVLQQLPKPSHCLLLHCCQAGGGGLLQLLLLLLLLQLPPLPDLGLMLLLRGSKRCRLQEGTDELLARRHTRCLLLLGRCQLCLLLTLLDA